MLSAPPPGYNTTAVNRQMGPLPVPGAQGVPIQGLSRLWHGANSKSPGTPGMFGQNQMWTPTSPSSSQAQAWSPTSNANLPLLLKALSGGK